MPNQNFNPFEKYADFGILKYLSENKSSAVSTREIMSSLKDKFSRKRISHDLEELAYDNLVTKIEKKD